MNISSLMEILSTRRSLILVLAGLVLQGGAATQLLAQDKFVTGVELPEMGMMVCVSLDAALVKAKIRRQQGLLSLEDAKARSTTTPDCRMLRIRARPYFLEDIAPYKTWVPTYDRLSPATVDVTIEGRSYSVSYSYKLQLCRIYRAVLTDGNGRRVEGWVEIPERPYVLEFLEAQSRPSR